MRDQKINTLIITEDVENLNYLNELLHNIEDINMVGYTSNTEQAIKFIISDHPELIFYNIKNTAKNGFDFLKKIKNWEQDIAIVFVSDETRYAIKAFEESAFDYLLNPVKPERLRQCIDKFIEEKEIHDLRKQMQEIVTKLGFSKKIRFNKRTGFILINPQTIIYCEADGNYTNIYLSNSRNETVSIQIGKVIERLNKEVFFRIGKSYLVNTNFLEGFDRKGRTCILSDGENIFTIPCTRSSITKFDSFFKFQ
ncbi:LytR/AlgR family response regulator transcription factor [Bacteroidota bacterium]